LTIFITKLFTDDDPWQDADELEDQVGFGVSQEELTDSALEKGGLA